MNIYTRMIDLMQSSLSHQGINQVQAISASIKAVEKLRSEIGGNNVYLPKRTTLLQKRARDRAIKTEFNGRNEDEISRKYKVSRSTIYRACRK